jgi:hypothetical protein
MTEDVIIIGAIAVAIVAYVGYSKGTVAGAAATTANDNYLDGSTFLSDIFNSF